jgi:putative membrane-bound dehydrogenase-like protein
LIDRAITVVSAVQTMSTHMNRFIFVFGFIVTVWFSAPELVGSEPPPRLKNPKALFDGRTLSGWEGNPKIWRVEDGCLTGGSYEETIKQNEFLATTRDYTNFVIRFKIKLTGSNGFINSGFQIRSQRVPNNSEMAGYQCDFGEPNWYGAIYDESRRNKLMAASDMKALRPVIKPQDWNDYVIRADGSRVTTWINGVLGVDYYEPDLSIPNYDWGKLGIQVHGGGKAVVQVKDIFIEELPAGNRFIGAPKPKDGAKASPLTPEEERASFSLPPGFEIELVASEDLAAGYGKFVAIDWDLQGRLWTMTALEYPVDANESPEVARALYASRARDKVLVYERDPKSPTGYATKPRVFADGLAIPLGILPYKNGAYVQHGADIVFLSDTDNDGKADRREVILTGFGVQDSHLFPHQFTRAPGNWVWMAQGAFNYGKVRTSKGSEVQFDQTRMAKFRYDGSEFDITSQGPCNIWGLVLDGNGQSWIQEANDFGFPVMPFHEYANYPGCSGGQWRSYAPEFPGTAPEFAMGGTGLSGLALSDSEPASAGRDKRRSTRRIWPAPYDGQFYIANPITRKIQAVQVTPEGPRFRYQKLPDFVLSSDEWFRPVALRTGPDGCLYLVDWYNKIISHNEVPRNHPERDKKRGRIWRVRHKDIEPWPVPDFTKLSGDELLAKLGGVALQQSHLAWQAITDRQLTNLAPRLKKLAGDKTLGTSRRLAALWALEGLRLADALTVKNLLKDADRNIRREALRTYADNPFANINDFEPLVRDADPEVRAQVARSLGRQLLATAGERGSSANGTRAVAALLQIGGAPLPGPTMKSTHTGRTIKSGPAYEREFERYLVRLNLERRPEAVADFLRSEAAGQLPAENRLLAALALEPKTGATEVARLLPQVDRPPGDEELLRLAQYPEQPGVSEAFKAIVRKPQTRNGAIESLLRVRTKLDATKLAPLLTESARELLAEGTTVDLGIRLASAFQLTAVEPELIKVLEAGWRWTPESGPNQAAVLQPTALSALRALGELKSDRVDTFTRLAARGQPEVQDAAIAALAASRNPLGSQRLATLYPTLPPAGRKAALTGLCTTKAGGQALVKAVRAGSVRKDDLDGAIFDKLQAVLGEDSDLAELMQEMAAFLRPALRLDGEDNAWTETDVTLNGAFTVETWIRLDSGIDNNDGILGVPGALDMNFFGGRFRVWVGGQIHDAIVAKKNTVPEVWSHLAVTRDVSGRFRIYQNGELDTDESKLATQAFEKVRIGWTAPGKGTAGWLSEFRIWNRERAAGEIRADFDRSFAGEEVPGLERLYTAGNWGRLHGGARILKTQDFPALLTATEAKAVAERFDFFRGLAEKEGDSRRGAGLFTTTCLTCHTVAGRGGQIGPVLNGAGALGVEALLRNILTPNAAMEPGYRVFRVEMKDGEIVDGLLVSQDKEAIVLRRQRAEDLRIPQTSVKRAGYTKLSVMPEGLLDAFQAKDVTDLFAYLKTLK